MLEIRPYVRKDAVAYAQAWANKRNPRFLDFAGLGGDCTNFISQCVFAGSCVMNYTPDYGWYYISANDRAPAWTGVQYFYNFFTTNQGVGPFAKETYPGGLELGDVIQLGDENGVFYHTLIVTGFWRNTYLVNAHTIDSRNRPLDTYRYTLIRYLHIEGIRTGNKAPDACFARMMDGSVR